jgi:aromatic ring-opening dioxygenase catalytic subunit (LigB family)
MYSLEEKRYTRQWREIGAAFRDHEAILWFSAHWTTEASAFRTAFILELSSIFRVSEALYEVIYLRQVLRACSSGCRTARMPDGQKQGV